MDNDDKIIEELKKKQDTQCVVSNIPYEKVLELQNILKAKNVDCNVVAGGFAIYANYQDPRVISACKKFGTVARPGVSRHINFQN